LRIPQPDQKERSIGDGSYESSCTVWGVQGAVGAVVPGVFHDEEDGNLVGHGENRGEGNGRREAAKLRERVEEPDLRELDVKVGEEDEFGAEGGAGKEDCLICRRDGWWQ
jgi:hypothetical protein